MLWEDFDAISLGRLFFFYLIFLRKYFMFWYFRNDCCIWWNHNFYFLSMEKGFPAWKISVWNPTFLYVRLNTDRPS